VTGNKARRVTGRRGCGGMNALSLNIRIVTAKKREPWVGGRASSDDNTSSATYALRPALPDVFQIAPPGIARHAGCG
jgi:hypothetical protein